MHAVHHAVSDLHRFNQSSTTLKLFRHRFSATNMIANCCERYLYHRYRVALANRSLGSRSYQIVHTFANGSVIEG